MRIAKEEKRNTRRCSQCFDTEDHRAAVKTFFFLKGFRQRSRKASKTKVKLPLELPDLRPLIQKGGKEFLTSRRKVKDN